MFYIIYSYTSSGRVYFHPAGIDQPDALFECNFINSKSGIRWSAVKSICHLLRLSTSLTSEVCCVLLTLVNIYAILVYMEDEVNCNLLSSQCCNIILTHCGLVTPYGNMELGQYWLRQRLVAWRHQAITWTNVDLSLVSSHGIHFKTLSLDDVKILINKTRLKVAVLKRHPVLPGANELRYIDIKLSHFLW